MTRVLPPITDYTAGDSYVLNTKVREPTGEVVSLTGASVEWGLADSASGTPLLTKDTNDGIRITDAENGEFSVTISPEDTEDLAGNYYHEAEITESSGAVSTVFTGQFRINPSIV